MMIRCSSFTRRAWAWSSTLFLLVFLVANERLEAQSPDKSQLTAAYLHNFSNFVTWPDEALSPKKETLVFCILGKDEVFELLEYITKKNNEQRNVNQQLHVPASLDVLHDCHILYISDSEANRVPVILQKVGNLPILTVSSLPGFARAGGMLEFFMEQEKLRFYLNLEATRAAGLVPDANFVKLSRLVN